MRISDWSSDVCSSDLAYEPPLPSHVRAIDGTPIHEFARERRVYLTYDELPETLIEAFISAEDKTFFSHGGLDYPGIVSAVIDNLTSNKRPRGASTITQQRSEEHTSELQSLMRSSIAVFCLKKKNK